jgi:hypothetical protein
MPNSEGCGLILDGCPEPDMLGNLATSEEVSVLFHEPLGPAWPLGQDLVHMPRRNEHNLTYGADESIWDILVE